MSVRSLKRGSLQSSATSPTSSPYHRALPPSANVQEDPLRLRLDFHEESVVVHDYAGGVTRTKLVSALDVAHALARELDLTTGLLPPEALWWAKTANGVRIAVWREPRVWTVRLRERYDAKPRQLRLPMPGLVFVCLPARQAPFVFAARERPRSLADQLFRCPAYNVFDSGRVCPGSQRLPRRPGESARGLFREPLLGHARHRPGKSQRHPEDIGQLWAELGGEAAYPLDDLVPQLQAADALKIGE